MSVNSDSDLWTRIRTRLGLGLTGLDYITAARGKLINNLALIVLEEENNSKPASEKVTSELFTSHPGKNVSHQRIA